MIRAIAAEKRAAFQGGAIRKWLSSAALSGGLILASALMARATPIEGGAPFMMAFAAAGLCAGAPWWAMLIGCGLGTPWLSLGLLGLLPVAGLLAVVLIHYGLGKIPYFAPDEDGHVRMRDARCAAMAGIGMLIAALPLVRDVPHDAIMALINVALAIAAAPTMISAFLVGASRARLLPEERISVVLVIMCALIGIWYLPGGMGLGRMAACVIALMGALCSVGAGAVCGVLTGGLLTILGDTPYVGMALALCALGAGAVRQLGRPAMALAFAAVNGIAGVLGASGEIFAINPYITLLAGLVMCLTPTGAQQRLAGWFAPPMGSPDAERVAARARGEAEKRTRALGLLFKEMATGYDSPSPLPEEAELIAAMRAKLCTGCQVYDKCWSGANSRANRLLVGMLSDALCGNVIDSKLTELPPDVCRRCRRANQIPKKLGPMLSQFDETRRAARERGECKALLASQFQMASEALIAQSDQLASPMRISRALAQEAAAALDREGLSTADVWALEDESAQLFVELKDRQWNKSAQSRAAQALASHMGCPMAAAPSGKKGELCFSPGPSLAADVGYASCPGRKGVQSGDSYLACALMEGQVLLALSDGMGSGARAQSESASALRLLRRFLTAGVPCEMALSAVNELLLLRTGDEMFATADLCVLDLMAGRAQFIKLGSCATLLMRRDKPVMIEGGRLPLGVLGKVKPIERTVRLQIGDLIVMVTDGVLDGSRDGDEEWLVSMVRRYGGGEVKELCERLVTLCAARSGAKQDDMTVLAARIGEVQG